MKTTITLPHFETLSKKDKENLLHSNAFSEELLEKVNDADFLEESWIEIATEMCGKKKIK